MYQLKQQDRKQDGMTSASCDILVSLSLSKCVLCYCNRIVRLGQFIAETDLVYGAGGRRVQNQGAACGGMKSLNRRHQRAEKV